MKYILTLTISLVVCSFNYSYITKEPDYSIRKNGFYLYDNGIDTLKILPDSKEIYLMTIELLRQKGIISEHKMPCRPDSVVVLEGSMFLHYLAFFTDSSGTGFAHSCKDSANIAHVVDVIHERKRIGILQNSVAKYQMINRVTKTNDSSIEFYISRDGYFEEHFTGTISKNGDSMHLYVQRGVNPTGLNGIDVDRVYKFVPFKGY